MIGGMLLAAAVLVSAPPPSLVAQTFSAPAEASNAFIECLERSAKGGWSGLRRSGELLSNRVFRKVGQRNGQPGIDWSVLIVSAAKSDTSAPALVAVPQRCSRSTGTRLVRAEIMRATPASYHPAPVSRLIRPDLAFVVEFIDVRNEVAALEEYRETMRTSIGPAVGRLVRENKLYSMIGLETAKVMQHSDSRFDWNQLHIRGYYPEVASRLAMSRYMQEVNPRRGGFSQVFGRLDAIRTKPRDDIAQEVTRLSL